MEMRVNGHQVIIWASESGLGFGATIDGRCWAYFVTELDAIRMAISVINAPSF